MADEENIQGEFSKKRKSKTGFYYSFLTVVLLLCLIQIGFGAILNISKTIAYHAKISTLTKIRDAAEAHNQDLKEDIKQFSSTSSLEGIARNNLKMAGEDEVLVLINQPQNTVQKNKKKKKSKKKHAGNS
ncbi:septum formation initiator family protein [bacterium]|nr:septum formation initiator family protein [bacterium]